LPKICLNLLRGNGEDNNTNNKETPTKPVLVLCKKWQQSDLCVNFSALLIIRLEVQSDKIALQVCPSSMILGITIHYSTAQEAGVSGIKQNGGFGCMNGDGIRVHQ